MVRRPRSSAPRRAAACSNVLLVAALGLVTACNADPFFAAGPDLAQEPLFGDDAGTDIAVPACQDGRREGDESDTDCGGAECAACPAGKGCRADKDCQSAICIAGSCAAGPTCNDQRRDGAETDIDCGGPDCAACALARACRRDSDCASVLCVRDTCSKRLTLSFGPAIVTATTARDCWAAAPGDFDGDKQLDLVVGSYAGGNVQALYGRGDGTFLPGGFGVPGPSQLTMLAAADFDSDGKDDVAGAWHGTAMVLLAGPQRTLLPAKVVARTGAEVIAAGDWDRDKRPDLVVGEAADFSLLSGDGKGGFRAPVTGMVLKDAYPVIAIAVGDLDRDGHPDLFATHGTSSVAVTGPPRNGRWNAVYMGGQPMLAGSNTTHADCGVGDFDHDGSTDLLTYQAAGALVVIRGDGKGGFLAPVENVAPPGSGASFLRVADLDQDGFDDVVFAGPGLRTLNIWRGVAAGRFTAGPTLQTPDNMRTTALGDWYGDGKLDIAVTMSVLVDPAVAVFLNTSN